MRNIHPQEASEFIITPKDLSEELITLETTNIHEEIRKFLENDKAEIQIIDPIIADREREEVSNEIREIINQEDTTGLFFTVDREDSTQGLYMEVHKDTKDNQVKLITSKGRDTTTENVAEELLELVDVLNISLWKVTEKEGE